MKMNILKTAAVLSFCAVMALAGCSSSGETTENTEGSEEQTDTELTDEQKAYQEYIENLSSEGDAFPQLDPPEAGEEIAVIHTSMGDIKVRFFPDEAPKAGENFKTLAKDGYYDGITFHRVINDFMIQAGDPTGLPKECL